MRKHLILASISAVSLILSSQEKAYAAEPSLAVERTLEQTQLKVPNFKRYLQYDLNASWHKDWFETDSSGKKIPKNMPFRKKPFKSLGCLATSWSMAIQFFGIDLDPLKLSLRIGPGGYGQSAVKQVIMSEVPSLKGHVRMEHVAEKGKPRSEIEKAALALVRDNFASSNPTPMIGRVDIDNIDQDDGKDNGDHYVTIVGVTKSGDPLIFDPGWNQAPNAKGLPIRLSEARASKTRKFTLVEAIAIRIPSGTPLHLSNTSNSETASPEAKADEPKESSPESPPANELQATQSAPATQATTNATYADYGYWEALYGNEIYTWYTSDGKNQHRYADNTRLKDRQIAIWKRWKEPLNQAFPLDRLVGIAQAAAKQVRIPFEWIMGTMMFESSKFSNKTKPNSQSTFGSHGIPGPSGSMKKPNNDAGQGVAQMQIKPYEAATKAVDGTAINMPKLKPIWWKHSDIINPKLGIWTLAYRLRSIINARYQGDETKVKPEDVGAWWTGKMDWAHALKVYEERLSKWKSGELKDKPAYPSGKKRGEFYVSKTIQDLKSKNVSTALQANDLLFPEKNAMKAAVR